MKVPDKKEEEESQQQKNLCMRTPRYRPPFHEHAAYSPPLFFFFLPNDGVWFAGLPSSFDLSGTWPKGKEKNRDKLICMTLSWTQYTFCLRVIEKWLSSIFFCWLSTQLDMEWAMGTASTSSLSTTTSMTSSITSNWCEKSIHKFQSLLSDTRWWVCFSFFPTIANLREKSMKWFVVFSCLFIGWYDSPIGCFERAIGIRWCRLDGTTDSHWSSPCLTRQTLGCQNTQPCHSSPCGIHLFYVFYFWNFWPHVFLYFQVSSLNVEHITSDQAEQELIKNDPLVWKGGVKCKWATATHECLVVIQWILNSFNCIFNSVGLIFRKLTRN